MLILYSIIYIIGILVLTILYLFYILFFSVITSTSQYTTERINLCLKDILQTNYILFLLQNILIFYLFE